jgi:hypothetical protein
MKEKSQVKKKKGLQRELSLWGGRTMELLESLSVPWRRDTRDIIKILVGARIS